MGKRKSSPRLATTPLSDVVSIHYDQIFSQYTFKINVVAIFAKIVALDKGIA